MTVLTVADVLDRAADLIEPEGAWIQGGLGRDKNGRFVDAGNIVDAICFCMAGAIWRAVGLPYDQASGPVHDDIFPFVNASARQANGIGPWNDAPERTQPEVVAALRKAATLARETSK